MKTTINSISTILSTLSKYQIDRVNQLVIDFDNCNKAVNNFEVDKCPKCGVVHPKFILGGKTAAGKQMIRCKECNKRFVIDHGQLTFYSHQSQAKWDDMIKLTITGESIKKTSSQLDVNESTAFRMRHKLLNSFESINFPRNTK